MTPHLAARLSEHVYGRSDPPLQASGSFEFRDPASGRATIVDMVHVVDNPRTGYQGAVYRDRHSGEYIVAHRGTEFDREAMRDGVIADGGMVAARINTQMPDAMALTRWAVQQSRLNPTNGEPSEVSVTGHSLGGTLAQATAFRFQLPGHTFNAYGAIGINGIPDDARAPVVNHARVTDVVSAGNRHVGDVRLYARQEDFSRSSSVPAVLSIAGPAHAISEFSGPRSLLSDPQALARADVGRPLFEPRRNEIALLRGGITLAAEAHLQQRELVGRGVGATLDGAGVVGNVAIDGAGRAAAGWTATVSQGGAIAARGSAEVGALAQQGGARVAGAVSRVDNELRAGRDEALAGVMRLAEWAAPRWVGVGGSEFFERRAERERAQGREHQAGLVASGDSAAERTRDGGRAAATAIRDSGAVAAERTREATDRAGDTVRGSLQQAAGIVRDATARPTGPMYREPEVAPPLSDRRHPQFALYDGVARGIDALPAGVRPEAADARERLSAALAGQLYMQGIRGADHVVASPDGQRVFAVNGRLGDPAAHVASVPMAAERQPVLQSTQMVDDLRETRERQARQDVATPLMAR
jgi:hypothetical protein